MNLPECLVIVALAVISACYDWKQRIIPNWLTMGGICFGFLLSIFQGTFDFSLIGFCSSCLLSIPFKKGWIGGGDVKLLMAYATLLGPWHFIDLWLDAAVLSVPIVLYISHRQKRSWREVGIPYAVPLAMTAFWIVGKGVMFP